MVIQHGLFIFCLEIYEVHKGCEMKIQPGADFLVPRRGGYFFSGYNT